MAAWTKDIKTTSTKREKDVEGFVAGANESRGDNKQKKKNVDRGEKDLVRDVWQKRKKG